MSHSRLRGFAKVAVITSAWIVFSGLAMSSARAGFAVPQLTGPVVDGAELLDVDQFREIDAALRSVRSSGGPQINVVTVRSLEGETVEGASIKIADAWKVGGAKKDDGVIFLVALEERKLRIEVGQGLEGVLTDLDSKRIIADQVTPFFRAGRPGDGIVAGVRGILLKVAPDELKKLGDAPAEVQPRSKSRSRGIPWPVLIGLFILISIFGRGGRGGGGRGILSAIALGSLASSGRGGGGWSSGGGGGGGWSGGGGGFSGGGASGGW
ncbi:hypothetical protein BH10BDE1_BH10BDE1_05920 [soil metagenome]